MRGKQWLWVALCVVLLDGFFKYLALRTLPLAETRSVFGFVTLGLHKNPGIAFNLPFPQPVLWLVTGILLLWLLFLARRHWKQTPLLSSGALLTAIGAAGNFADRLLNGFTTDYILFFTGAAVNLADGVIIAGVLLMIFSEQRSKKRKLPTEHD